MIDKIKVIKTKDEYEEALKLVEGLMDKNPAPESEEGEKLSLLIALIKDYESNKFPVTPREMRKMKTIVGIRPTGKLHIGHYFSVIKPAKEEGAKVLVARYHAPEGDWARLVQDLNRFGIKPNLQEIDATIYFNLLNVARFGELSRMTQFKSQKPTPHLFVYPVLMAHDLYGYSKVIVGDDQRQHIEYANVLFKRLGLPQIKGDYRGGRIMDLRKPDQKMSKSNPKGCLFLDDSREETRKKVMSAVTTPQGERNLRELYKMLGGKGKPARNIDLKEKLIDLLSLERKRE